MGTLFMITPFIGIFLVIIGGIGLFITNTNLVFGDLLWIHANIIYGVFALIGLAIIVCIVVSGSEVE